eukprot:4466409-Alexandrium_andersonii.AAC.1
MAGLGRASSNVFPELAAYFKSMDVKHSACFWAMRLATTPTEARAATQLPLAFGPSLSSAGPLAVPIGICQRPRLRRLL